MGQQRYGANVWSGDTGSSWESLRNQVPAGLNYSLCGMPHWNNDIGGFFARLEASRKFIFGAASVYGENNDNVIQGAFVIRGQDALPAFDVAPDYESYEFTKLDPSKEEDREFVNDQWAWDKPLTVNGKTMEWADGKVFK